MKIIANGGLTTHNKSNTIDAILLTKNASYVDGVLLDVRLTLDNIVVIVKNDDLSIDTLGMGKVSEMKYKDIRKVKFPSKIFKYYIPTLDEVLKLYKSSKKIILNLHPLKDRNENLVLEVLKIVSKYQDYNFFLESVSKEIIDYLFLYGNNYKIGKKMSNVLSKCDGESSFCDISYHYMHPYVNTYDDILVHVVNEEYQIDKVLDHVINNKYNDLHIITDFPKKISDFLYSVRKIK